MISIRTIVRGYGDVSVTALHSNTLGSNPVRGFSLHVFYRAAKVPTVPESVVKKRNTTAKLAVARAANVDKLKKKRAANRKTIFKRAEKYVKEYRNAEKQQVFFRRQAKAAGNFYREPEARLAFVVRIRGINGIHPTHRKILQLLRLRAINHGVFVKLTKATIAMLKRVEPFIAYGYPNLKSVKELIYKRGFVNVNKQRKPITDNTIIEESLGKHNVICVEDIIHEIFTCGEHFKQVNKFLAPFKLSSPKGGFNRKLIHFQEGGDAGNHEENINKLIQKMI